MCCWPSCSPACSPAYHHPQTLRLASPRAGEKLVQLVYEALDAATGAETAHAEELAAKRVLDKAHIKAMAGRRRRELTGRCLYTKPLTPVAGQPVDIFYNPGGGLF